MKLFETLCRWKSLTYQLTKANNLHIQSLYYAYGYEFQTLGLNLGLRK